MTLVDDLTGILGADRVKHHPLELRVYDKDAGVTRGEVAAVALPETAAEVAACVKAAVTWDVPVVARGAGTGLAGGAVPTEPALILALTRMNTIHELRGSGPG